MSRRGANWRRSGKAFVIRSFSIVAGVVLLAAVAAVMLASRPDDPVPPPPPERPPAPPEETVSPIERDLPPLPPNAPAYLPQETEFERTFIRIRTQYIADPHTTLQRGAYRRYLSDQGAAAEALLKRSASSDPHDRFRAWSVTILGDFKRADLADEVFVPRLRDDAFYGVRKAAALALGRLGDAAYLDELRAAAANDPHADVRAAADEAIRFILEGKE